MSDLEIERFEHNGKTCIIEYDTEPDLFNPRDGDELGIMLANGHRRYTLGDEAMKGGGTCAYARMKTGEYEEAEAALTHFAERGKIRLFPRWCRIVLGSTVVLPLGLIDHSGISMYVGSGAHAQDPGGWDSGLVGFIFDTAATREQIGTPPESVERCLRQEVEIYDQYLTGQVYAYTIEDEDGNIVGGCGGFLGSLDYVRQSARDEAGYTCKHCGHEINRAIGPVIDAPEGAEAGGAYEWTHGLCKVCDGPTAWGKEGQYHVELDVSLANHHKAQSVRKRACPGGDTVAEPEQFVGSYE